MSKFPGRLRIIQCWRISSELELFHHRLRPAFFPLQQERHVNLEFDQLRSLIFVTTGRSLKQRFETLSRLCVVFFLKWNLCEIVLRLTEFRIQFGRFFEGSLRLVELLLLHQNFATQIQSRGLIRLRLIRLID